MDLIPLVIIAIVILLLFLRGRKPESGQHEPVVYGISLYFNRSDVPNYLAEGKKKLNELPIWDILSDFDIKAIKAMSTHETGFLSAPLAQNFVVNNNNILGIEKQGHARYFINVNECFRYFRNLMLTSRYTSAYAVRHDGIEFIKKLRECGYNSRQSWQDSIIDIYNAW